MTRTAYAPKPKTQASAEKPAQKKKESMRDLIEQIVVAFILAFLIRGFEAEAFVIPTGSMAPTLYGQHKEVTCPQCQEVFSVNAAEESDFARAPVNGNGQPILPMINTASCPNCHYRVTNLAESPTFKGDRILVMKFLYNLPRWLGGRLPARWDVVVFHFPEEPETNYIKRLVGLPGEVLRIYFGDLYTKPLNSKEPFVIARKPLPQQQEMQQLVWDDSHRPKAFAGLPEWKRWQPPAPGWSEQTEGTFKASSAGWSELGYHNLVPTPRQWQAALNGKKIPGSPRASLITDLYGYNSGGSKFERVDTSDWFRPHWVGDLTISAQVRASSGKGGKLRFDLIEAGVVHRCAIDLASGDAILSRAGKPLGTVTTTKLRDDGKWHDVTFANVDDRLTLWVDGQTPFGDGITYENDPEDHGAPTVADLVPVTMAASGGEIEATGLVLKRDIYYTLNPGSRSSSDYEQLDISWPRNGDIEELLDQLSNPANFATLGGLKAVEYPINPNRYMMMGDNSPRSSDSRAWTHDDATGYRDRRTGVMVPGWADPKEREVYEVPESLIIGKAFFIYWPHGVPFWPNIAITRDFRFPFRPYVERMRWIR